MIFFDGNIDKRVVRITESQQRQLLSEAADDGFNYAELENARDMYDAFEYCYEHLGKPVGDGSSRTVFQLDDFRVIKVAKSRAGVAQNNVEAQMAHNEYECFPRVFNKSENGSWLDCEYVLPAEENDFQEVMGMSWDDVAWVLRTIFSQYGKGYPTFKQERYDRMNELVKKDTVWRGIYNYMMKEQVPLGDLIRIDNWGMTRRNGKTIMVILDSGFNYEVYNNFYK